MDKEISQEVSLKNRKKAVVFTLVTVAGLIISVWLVRVIFKSSIKKSDITTAVVETGNIENTINATGEV